MSQGPLPGDRQPWGMRPSVLDRLLDARPQQPESPSDHALLDLSGYRAQVARDVETLLNTRRSDPHDRAADFPEASRSILRYGIMDLNSLTLQDPDDQTALREDIRRAIELFEPRLSKVRVALDLPRGSERALRFRVGAVLSAHPQRPGVTFDATLHLTSNAYQVRDRD